VRDALASALAAAETLEVLLVHDRRAGEARLDLDLAADPRARLIESPAPGVSTARNAAIELARGPYLAFLDDDDVWLPGHLARATEMFDRYPDTLMVGGEARIFVDTTGDGSAETPTNVASLPRLRPGTVEGPVPLGELLMDNPFHPSTVSLVREKLRAEDRFDPGRAHMEDYDFWLRLARRREPVFQARPTVVIRRHRRNASRDWRRMAQGSIEVLDRFLERGVEDDVPALANRLRRRYGRLWHDLAYAHLVEGRPAAARRALRASIVRLPLNLKNYIYFLASTLPGPARNAVFARGRRIRNWNQPAPTEPARRSP
jgi:glycosyltransferase involved in cell wall biosynthesis